MLGNGLGRTFSRFRLGLKDSAEEQDACYCNNVWFKQKIIRMATVFMMSEVQVECKKVDDGKALHTTSTPSFDVGTKAKVTMEGNGTGNKNLA